MPPPKAAPKARERGGAASNIPLARGVQRRLGRVGESAVLSALGLGALAAARKFNPRVQRAKSGVSALEKPAQQVRTQFNQVEKEKTAVFNDYNEINQTMITLRNENINMIKMRQEFQTTFDVVSTIYADSQRRSLSNMEKQSVNNIIASFEERKTEIERQRNRFLEDFQKLELRVAAYKIAVRQLEEEFARFHTEYRKLQNDVKKVQADLKRSGNIPLLRVKGDLDIEDVAEEKNIKLDIPSADEVSILKSEITRLANANFDSMIREIQKDIADQINEIFKYVSELRILTDKLEVAIQPTIPAQSQQPAQIIRVSYGVELPTDIVERAFNEVRPEIPRRRFPGVRKYLNELIFVQGHPNVSTEKLVQTLLSIAETMVGATGATRVTRATRTQHTSIKIPDVIEQVSPDDKSRISSVIRNLARLIQESTNT